MGLISYASDLASYARYRVSKALEPNRFISAATNTFEETHQAIKPEDHRRLSGAYKNAAYVCANKIATAVASTPLKMFVAKGSDRKLVNQTKKISKIKQKELKADPTLSRRLTKAVEIEEVLDHPFLDLMSNINPFYNYFDFLMLTDINLELMGNSFWYVVKDSFGLPAELWVIPTQHMWVVPDRELFIKGYVMQKTMIGATGLMKIPFEEPEIIHFKEPSPNNLYYGVSWLGAMSEAYNLQINIDRYDVAFFSNMARPDGVLQAPEKGIVTPTAFRRLKNEFKQRFGGVMNVLTPLVLEGGMEWKQISQPPADLGLKESRRDALERMSMASGVPLAKLITENVNKANAEAAQTDFLRDTVKPKLTLIQEKINEKIMPLYGAEFFVAFDEVLPEDKDFSLKQDEMDFKNGLRTRNEIRIDRGMMPYTEGGDELPPLPGVTEVVSGEEAGTEETEEEKRLVAVKSYPVELAAEENEQGLLTYVTEHEKDGTLYCGTVKVDSWESAQRLCDRNGSMVVGEFVDYAEVLSLKGRTKEDRDIYWKAFDKRTEPLEKKFKKKIIEYFEKQKKRVLANLRKFKSAKVVVKITEGNIDDILFGTDHWRNEYRDILEDEYQRIAVSAGEGAEADIPGLSFDVDNPDIQDSIGNRLDNIADDINETTINRLRTQLQTGIANGESITQLTARIEQVYEVATGSRAVMIARTETISGYAEASLSGYKQSGVVDKTEWIATRDDRVRDDHLALDGKEVKLGKKFTFPDGVKTKGPGLSNEAHQDINCRCFVDGQMPIYTDNGWKHIRHIKKGDMVLTHKGRFKKVTSVLQDKKKSLWSKYKGEVVKITIAVPSRNIANSNKKTKSLFITVTPEHPILVNGGFKEAGSISKKDRVIVVGRICLNCDKPFPIVKFRHHSFDYLPKYCSLSCACSYTAIDQWKNTDMRKVMSIKASEQMKREYLNGTRDKFAITKKANNKMRKLIKEGKWVLQAGNHTHSPRYFDTDIELKMEAELIKRKIRYEKQYLIAGHFVDFYILENEAVIECNGDYWHSSKEQRKRDAKKRKRIEGIGVPVFEYWGSEINKNVSKCVNHFEHSVLNHTGEYTDIAVPVISIKRWELKRARRLYNFSVEGDESYVAKGIITHNCSLAPIVDLET